MIFGTSHPHFGFFDIGFARLFFIGRHTDVVKSFCHRRKFTGKSDNGQDPRFTNQQGTFGESIEYVRRINRVRSTNQPCSFVFKNRARRGVGVTYRTNPIRAETFGEFIGDGFASLK